MAGKEQDTEIGELIGVCLRYCQDGQEVDVWLDISKVQAIAWTTGKVDQRQSNPPHGNNPIPSTKSAAKCKPVAGDGDTQVCWWTGSAWVCD
jgi:hypothetical protein